MKKVLLAILVIAFAFSLAACREVNDKEIDIEDKNSYGELPPEDALLPDEYTAKQNLAYIAGVLSIQKNYVSVTTGKATASVIGIPYNQNIYNVKEMYEGKMLSLACSESAFVNIAEEKYFADDRVLVRRQTQKSKINGKETQFPEGDPSALTYDEYDMRYGQNPAKAATDYIINDETIISASLKKAGNEYSVSCELEPEKSTALYRRQVRTMAGSAGYPVFHAVNATFKFGADWKLTRISVHEIYDIDMLGGITCTGDMQIAFTYGNANGSRHEYYGRYEDKEVDKDERELTAAVCLADGFADVINGKSALKLTLNAVDRQITAYLRLDLESGKYIIKTGNMQAVYADALYFKSDGKVYKIDVAALSDGEALDADAILNSLAEGEFAVEGGKAELVSRLNIGEAEIALTLTFDVEGLEVKGFAGAHAEFEVGGEKIEASAVAVPAENLFEEFDIQSAADLTGSIQRLTELAKGQRLNVKADIALGVGDVRAEGTADIHIDLIDGNALADIAVQVNGEAYRAELTYFGGELFVDIEGYKFALGKASAIRDFAHKTADLLHKVVDEGGSLGLEALGMGAGDVIDLILDLTEGGSTAPIDLDRFAAEGIVSLGGYSFEIAGARICVDKLEISAASSEREISAPEGCADYTGLFGLAGEWDLAPAFDGSGALALSLSFGESTIAAYFSADINAGTVRAKIGAIEALYDGELYFKAADGLYKLDVNRINAAASETVVPQALAEQNKNPALITALEILSRISVGEDGKIAGDFEVFGNRLTVELSVDEGAHGFAEWGGYRLEFSADIQACDFEIEGTEGAVDLTPEALRLYDLSKASRFDIAVDLTVEVNGQTAEVKGGHAQADKDSGNFALNANVDYKGFDYSAEAMLIGDRLYFTLGDDKYVFGGDDIANIKALIEAVKGMLGSAQGERVAGGDIAAMLNSADIDVYGLVGQLIALIEQPLLDFSRIKDGVFALCGEGLEFSAFGSTVKISSLEVSAGVSEREFIADDAQYTDMTSLFGLIRSAFDYYAASGDEDGNLAFSLCGTASLDLKAITVEVNIISADLAISESGEFEGVIKLGYNFLTDKYKTVVYINGSGETTVVIKDGVLYFERVQKSKAKRKMLTYAEEWFEESAYQYEYMRCTFGYLTHNYLDVLTFAFNFNEGLIKIIKPLIPKDQAPSEERPNERFAISDYLKSYAYADNTYNITLNIGKMANDEKTLGDMALTVAVTPDLRPQSLSAQMILVNFIGLNAALEFSDAPAYGEIVAAGGAVIESAAECELLEETA